MLEARSRTVCFDGAEMDYICFGRGKKALVILPGLGDGLRTVKGTALPMALIYRQLGKEYTVYMFSRRRNLPHGYGTREMAQDQSRAMRELGIARADVVGVSMGGMIAQHLAILHPDQVGKVVLAVTAAQPDALMEKRINGWKQLARSETYPALMDSNMRHIYSQAYYRRNRWTLPLVSRLTRPQSFERFLIQAEACLSHDVWDGLKQIQTPVLVVGGEKDDVLGAEASRRIARQIPQATLHMYDQWGHGLYEEAPDFWDVVLRFLKAAQ